MRNPKFIGKRVTKMPELFLLKETGIYGDNTFILYKANGGVFSQHKTEELAKNAAIKMAKFFLSMSPEHRRYLKDHTEKVKSFESLNRTAFGKLKNSKFTDDQLESLVDLIDENEDKKQ